MCYSVIQDVLHTPQRRFFHWGKRLAGLVIVVSGGALLAVDLVSTFSAVSSNSPHEARISVASTSPALP